MKMVSVKCPNCGAGHSITPNTKLIHCEYCNQDFVVDDEVKRVQLVNAEQAGYEFEKGRRRAIREEEQAKKKVVQSAYIAPLEKFIDIVCPYCGTADSITDKKDDVICSRCGVGYSVKVAKYLHQARLYERLRKHNQAIGQYYKAYALDNSSIIAREGILKCKDALKDYAFIRVSVPHIITKDETLEFRIGLMAQVKEKGKEKVFYYANMSNIGNDDKSFWFVYPGSGTIYYFTEAPAYAAKFLINAKNGKYPSFKDIR